ncbi:MAG: hypothetical protein GVY08_07115 [Bacteroidetes bacterium]|jgi:hypothetical protein|nr:hypothetical protein [Bacteroidota bacterium]
MKTTSAAFAVLFSLLLFIPALYAQELNAGVNLQAVIPQNEFSESINTEGGGFHLFGLYRFGQSPFGLGLDFNFINFGRDTRDEPLSSTIPDLRVQVENEYNLIQGLMLAKVQPPDGIFRPYAEGLAGFNYFFTQTSIENRRNTGGEPIATDTNFDDWGFAWGGGGGVMVRVFDRRGSETYNSENPVAAGYINAGVRFLNGSEAEYLREGSIIVENGTVSFDTLQSRTDMLIIQLGFVLRF